MNPIFPLNEYVPDGEPHVFDNRVYLYGSHDKAGGDRFCMDDYTVWSAPVADLTDWTCHGITYKKSQDPRSKEGRLVDFYAPDCVRGNDGKYYLYYFAAGPNTTPFGPMAVAVSDKPEGPFEYFSDIKYKDGSPVLKYLTNDPAVINDNGRIYLYYGWGLGRNFRNKLLKPLYNFVLSMLCRRPYKEVKNTNPSILSCAVVELESDMCTVKHEPKAVLDSVTSAKKRTELYNHAFYEAPSIRKFGELYYLVYSSGQNNELCYAISKCPDRDFTYRGIIISNSDLGYKGNKQRKAPAGTIHGGIECVNDKYYVFYHRCTNNTDFSRQACVEPIEILPDGTITQVEITTQGVGNPLPAKRSYSAALCCNLFSSKTVNVQGNGKGDKQPNITYKNGEHFITAITNGTVIGFKYINFDSPTKITVTTRGGSGTLMMCNQLGGKPIAKITLSETEKWQAFSEKLSAVRGTHALYFVYQGKGRIDMLNFSME